MAGYKRVNFYELCRLCASNQQKEKTHIFHEEGRKIQLQNKIQSCLSLKVCENDFLPKVVCSQCLQSLEDCFTFRNGCVSSEAMLSSYFSNFRHTEDFKKSGKVYIKDTTTKVSETPPMTATSLVTKSSDAPTPTSLIVNLQSNLKQEPQYYTVQVATNEKNVQKPEPNIPKGIHTTQPIGYNVNAMNLSALKMAYPKSDSLNDIINIEPDTLNSIISNSVRKSRMKSILISNNNNTNTKNDKSDNNMMVDNNLLQIDLAQQDNSYEIPIKNEFPIKNEKMKNNNQEPKYMYTFKIEEGTKNSAAFVLNQVGNLAQLQNFENLNSSSILNLQTSHVPQNNINLNNTTGGGGSNDNMKIQSDSHKTTSTINTSVFNNLNLVPSNINLNTNLNLVNMNTSTTNNIIHNGGTIIPSSSGQNNNMHLMNQTSHNLNIPNNTNLTNVTTNSVTINNQNITSPYITTSCNGLLNQTTNFTTNNNNNNNYNPTVNKNVLANLAVISRISNLTRSKNKNSDIVPLPGDSSINANNQIVFNNTGTETNTNTPTGGNSGGGVLPVKQHICDVCQKVFKRREHLYQHVKLHTGFRPFVCEHCNKSFMRKEHLLRHMISHSGQKNYTCNICEKSFSRNDNLLKHKKTHDKEQSYTCEICQKQFVMKHYYLAHKMAHEDEKVSFNQNWNSILKV